jgi:hypothetical protein
VLSDFDRTNIKSYFLVFELLSGTHTKKKAHTHTHHRCDLVDSQHGGVSWFQPVVPYFRLCFFLQLSFGLMGSSMVVNSRAAADMKTHIDVH